MFTGIVEEIGKVTLVHPGKLVIEASDTLVDTDIGGSIAVNGVCLTVTSFTAKAFSVDVMPETMKRTNLGLLSTGNRVNLERPLALGGRLGGHLVQGHIDATGKVNLIRRDNDAMIVGFKTLPDVLYYVVEKGFIAVDGVSLTVVYRDDVSFQVSMVDHTRRHTILGDRHVGDLVNLEVDIIAKYVEQFAPAQGKGITADFLKEQGFLIN